MIPGLRLRAVRRTAMHRHRAHSAGVSHTESTCDLVQRNTMGGVQVEAEVSGLGDVQDSHRHVRFQEEGWVRRSSVSHQAQKVSLSGLLLLLLLHTQTRGLHLLVEELKFKRGGGGQAGRRVRFRRKKLIATAKVAAGCSFRDTSPCQNLLSQRALSDYGQMVACPGTPEIRFVSAHSRAPCTGGVKAKDPDTVPSS